VEFGAEVGDGGVCFVAGEIFVWSAGGVAFERGCGCGGRRRGCCGLCLVVAIRVWFAGYGGCEEWGRGSPTVAVVGVGASLTVGIDHGCASGDVVLAWDVR